MAQIELDLETFKVHEKNEWSKDEAYLWCFGLLVDNVTLRSQEYILKTKPDHGNLGRGFKSGETRQIPDNVGRICSSVVPISLGGERLALAGVLVLAWEEDNTPNSRVVEAYNDSKTILQQHIQNRVASLNTGPLTQAEINAIVADLKKAIEKRFRAAVHWYNPFSWDPDDFIGFAQAIEIYKNDQPLNKSLAFTFTGDDAKYEVKGRLTITP